MSLEIVFEKGRQQVVLAKVSDHAGAVDWFKRRMRMDPTTRRWERVFLRSPDGQRTDVTEEILTMARSMCARENPINYAAKVCPRNNPVLRTSREIEEALEDQAFASGELFVKGSRRFHSDMAVELSKAARAERDPKVKQELLAASNAHRAIVAERDRDRTGLTRAEKEHLTSQIREFARLNPSKYADTAIGAAAHSSVVPAVLIGGGLIGLIYALTRPAHAASPPAANTPAPKTTPSAPPATTQRPELPLPTPLVQSRPISFDPNQPATPIAIMQAQLTALGYGTLRHDGVSGGLTQAATSDFLRNKGLNTPEGMTAFVNSSHLPVLPSDPLSVIYAIDYDYRYWHNIAQSDVLGSGSSTIA